MKLSETMAEGLQTKLNLAEFLESGWVFSHDSGQISLGWGAGQWHETQPADQAAIFAPDFYLQNKAAWWTSSNFLQLSRDELRTQLSAFPADAAPLPNLSWNEPASDWFAHRFADFQKRFRDPSSTDERLKKVVPVVFAQAQAPLPEKKSRLRRSLIAALESLATGLHLYGWWNQHEGILGLTPELLFRVETHKQGHAAVVASMALAGTAPGVLTPAQASAFRNDVKERSEHRFVIDDLCERLKGFGEIQIGETQVLQLASLAHLKTSVSVQLRRSAAFSDLVKTLHPTAALGAFPRKFDLPWMRSWDQVELRGRFGAPFGISKPGEINECLVAIRCVQWEDQEAARRYLVFSGCGVVAESQLEKEWQELMAKRQSVYRLLKL